MSGRKPQYQGLARSSTRAPKSPHGELRTPSDRDRERAPRAGRRVAPQSGRLVTARSRGHDRCFPPIATRAAHTLILGSLPGRRSLEQQQYYAHPKNAFWKLMAAIFDIEPDASYGRRTRALTRNGIALWDVFAAAERPGSLDSDIVSATAEANDFREFFRRHPKIRRVFFNGRKSEEIFRKRVLPQIGAEFPALRLFSLPSTSPAHAGMPFAQKLARWRVIRPERDQDRPGGSRGS
jgi:double-stranded uracil-DNA glycosylase